MNTTRVNLFFHEVSLLLDIQPEARKARDEVGDTMVGGVGAWRRLDTNLVVSEWKRAGEDGLREQSVTLLKQLWRLLREARWDGHAFNSSTALRVMGSFARRGKATPL